jgi:hypothetical protein
MSSDDYEELEKMVHSLQLLLQERYGEATMLDIGSMESTLII